jgi:hypothetical protein
VIKEMSKAEATSLIKKTYKLGLTLPMLILASVFGTWETAKTLRLREIAF